MKLKATNSARLAAAITMALTVSGVSAALQDRGVALYDADANVSWAKDGNLFMTLLASDPNLINHIIAVTPSVNDANLGGAATISADDFLTEQVPGGVKPGVMSWHGAIAFVNYLNSIQYGGVSNWRLPTVKPLGSAFSYEKDCREEATAADHSDFGYRIKSVKNELSHLYYVELGNSAAVTEACVAIDNPPPFQPGPFVNLLNQFYWSGTEMSDAVPGPQFAAAWGLVFSDGLSNFATDKGGSLLGGAKNGYVLPLHDGDHNSAGPTPTPEATATPAPTQAATPTPTTATAPTPTTEATTTPTVAATATPEPTGVATATPAPTGTAEPTPAATSTPAPTGLPTGIPTGLPTIAPTGVPTEVPTAAPTAAPTEMPTVAPTVAPTSVPTVAPTAVPSIVPTSVPSQVPTPVPTIEPTPVPSQTPTPTPVVIDNGDYHFSGDAYCQVKGKRRHRYAVFTARVNNDGDSVRPGAEFEINVEQDGESFDDLYIKPRSQVIYARPGRGKWISAVWEIEGEGDITFNASLNGGLESSTCTISGKDVKGSYGSSRYYGHKR